MKFAWDGCVCGITFHKSPTTCHDSVHVIVLFPVSSCCIDFSSRFRFPFPPRVVSSSSLIVCPHPQYFHLFCVCVYIVPVFPLSVASSSFCPRALLHSLYCSVVFSSSLVLTPACVLVDLAFA